MKSFTVLDRHLDVHQSYLLEASAGTGKTFSIENIVVRLLIEGDNPLLLDQLLVVTFTKEAAKDLKARIRANIERAIKALKGNGGSVYDYLLAIKEQNEEAIARAIRRLQNALFCFDQAQIFTIHGFCYKMLREHAFESDFSYDSLKGDETVGDVELLRVIRDCCPRLSAEVCSPNQLAIFLKKENWEQDLLRLIKEGYEVDPEPPFKDWLAPFQETRVKLVSKRQIDPNLLQQDLQLLLPFYKQLKGDCDSIIALIASKEWTLKGLDTLIGSDFYFVKKFDPSNKDNRKIKSFPTAAQLHYPGLVEELVDALKPFQKAADPHVIKARLLYECQKMVRGYLKEHEKFCFSDILQAMIEGCRQQEFLDQIRQRYAAAIIDEFQDTDPVQWSIFSRLFDIPDKKIYLVGDPKQSIYAFRRADIYTYKQAAERFDADHTGCLDTNFRSEPLLIEALNAFFGAKGDWMELPRTNETLHYYPVKASNKPSLELQDGRGNLHFLIGEDQNLFITFSVQEIISLHKKGLGYHRMAVLVKDRKQANRFAEECRRCNVPVVLQRQMLLSQSPMVLTLLDLLKAVLFPKEMSLLKIALGGPLIGWPHETIIALEDHERLEWTLARFLEMKRLLLNHGAIAFFAKFFQTRWNGDHSPTVSEQLLSCHEGDILLDQAEQLAALVIEHQNMTHCPPEGLVRYLEDFCKEEALDEEGIKVSRDPGKQAVQVITMHSSKGLEYDIVFALGLSAHPPEPSQLVPIPQGITCVLKPVDEDSDIYLQHCRERDAEKMRQLYVAMTRAKHRLYVPVFYSKKEKKSSSPMEIFLEKHQWHTPEALLSFISSHSHCMGYTHVDTAIVKEIPNEETHPLLQEPPTCSFHVDKYVMHSYTSLAKRAGKAVLEDAPKALPAPRIFKREDKNCHTLPAGSESGIIIHKLFEMVALRAYKDGAELKEFVSYYVKNTLYEEWTDVLAQMVWDVLHADLGGFCLKDVNPSKTYREMEFLYPYSEGYMKGVIDFVCEHNGRCYVIDWKSNWLGPSQEDYGQEVMERAMTEHDYHLQKHIYHNAWERFLKVADKKRSIEFGGIIYLFVRGVVAGADTGIYRA